MARRDLKLHTIALLPLKSAERAKSRLAGLLDPAQRRELLFTLAGRTIAALHAAPSIDELIVVTASREIAVFARRLGASAMLETEEDGMNAALSAAGNRLPRQARLLVVAGDLPLIDGPALEGLLASDAAVTLAADRHGLGTNALLCPASGLQPRFGDDSLRQHQAAARRTGDEVRVVVDERLDLDLDLAADFAELQRRDAALAAALWKRLQLGALTSEAA